MKPHHGKSWGGYIGEQDKHAFKSLQNGEFFNQVFAILCGMCCDRNGALNRDLFGKISHPTSSLYIPVLNLGNVLIPL